MHGRMQARRWTCAVLFTWGTPGPLNLAMEDGWYAFCASSSIDTRCKTPALLQNRHLRLTGQSANPSRGSSAAQGTDTAKLSRACKVWPLLRPAPDNRHKCKLLLLAAGRPKGKADGSVCEVGHCSNCNLDSMWWSRRPPPGRVWS